MDQTLMTEAENEVQRRGLPIKLCSGRLRDALTAFTAAHWATVEHQVVGPMLRSIGREIEPACYGIEEATFCLRAALLDMLEHVGGVPGQQAEVPSAPAEEIAAPAPSAPPSAPPQGLVVVSQAAEPDIEPLHLASIRQLIDEISTTQYDGMPHPRLTPLLKALVAECRMWMERVPSVSVPYAHLSAQVRTLKAVRDKSGVDAFIKGLARDHRENWERLAASNRAAVAKYDQDTEEPLDVKKNNAATPPRPRKEAPPVAGTPAHQWPALPRLRARMQQGCFLMLYGGREITEKITTIKERFGIDVEWYETDSQRPLLGEAAVNKAGGGKLAGVIMLEGVMHHHDWRRLSEACDAAGVPWTYGDKAGVGAMSLALAEIERKLSVAEAEAS